MIRIILALALIGAMPQSAQPTITAQETEVAGIEGVRAASARLQVNGTVGSGTIFLERDDAFFILTNSHVAGRVGTNVKVELWDDGRLRKPVSGKVVYSVRKNNYYRDIAVVEVSKAQLNGYIPRIIPLAPSGYKPDYSRIYSFGCGAGSWLTSWEGHAFSQESFSGDVINFFPQPAGGRSGSGIFSPDGKYIVALIAWRSPAGQHSLDGKNENLNYHGIAMTKDEIRAAFKGHSVANYFLPSEPELLVLPLICELEWNLNQYTDPVTDQITQFIQQDETPDCRTPDEHGATNVLSGRTLKYMELYSQGNAQTQESEAQLLQRRRLLQQQRPQAPPEPYNDGPHTFELPDENPLTPPQPQPQPQPQLAPQPQPQIQPAPQQMRPLPKLKEILPPPRKEFEEFELQKAQPDELELESTPDREPKPEPNQELNEAPQETPTASYILEDLLTVVLWAAAITGFFCWFKHPVMGLITTVAVWGGEAAVREKLEKKAAK